MLVVRNDELAVSALREAGLEALGFEEPMAALEAIEVSSRVRVLVRRVLFGPGKPNAVALARMLRIKRPLSAALPARLCGKCQTDSSTVASSMRATGSTRK
ncbi:MAG: hypothetical protein WA864_23410 [Acetobacteraceae bacterium]